MIRRLSICLAAVVAAGTVLVAAGVGQGSPPPRPALSAAAQRAEIAAVDHGGSLVHDGEKLFDSHGCDACHTIAAGGYGGRLGPRLDAPYLNEPVGAIESDIVDPPRDIPGYEAGLMPENFGSRFSQHDLAALAAFVHAAAHGASGAANGG